MYKRFEVRRKTSVPIEVITNYWDEPVKLMSDDLSPRGTYLISELMPELGDHIICSFDLNLNNDPFCFFGEVSRINWFRRKSDAGRPGFGVRFMDTTPMGRIKIREALRGLPPPTPSKMRSSVSISKIITV